MYLVVSSNTFKFRHDFLPTKVEASWCPQSHISALPHYEGWGHSLSSPFQGHHLQLHGGSSASSAQIPNLLIWVVSLNFSLKDRVCFCLCACNTDEAPHMKYHHTKIIMGRWQFGPFTFWFVLFGGFFVACVTILPGIGQRIHE